MDKNRTKFPNFIIGGAMKSGTSSIHYILNTHKDILIPNGELYYFDYDDIEQHRDHFLKDNDKILDYSLEKKYNWYQKKFNFFENDYLYGEDSTTYLASSLAPKRIYEKNPNVKLIFCLRNPVDRCYSHYYHLVKSKRINISFEKAIKTNYGNILQKSFYKEQINRYYNLFPNQNIKFVIFEKFIKSQQNTINELLYFLDLDQNIDITKIDTHQNKSKTPVSLKLQLFYNNFGSKLSYISYKNLFGDELTLKDKLFKFVDMIFDKINMNTKKRRPDMDSEVRMVLNDYFKKKNENLSELIDVNLENYWYK